MVARQLLMMEGVSGAGKSALAEAIAQRLGAAQIAVDLLPEEAIFARQEFKEVGRRFREKDWPTPEVMLASYRRIFEAAATLDANVVADWNAVAMIEDLPCAHPQRLATTSEEPSLMPDFAVLVDHAREVMGAWESTAVLLWLELPTEVAISRAARQRGADWLEKEASRGSSRGRNESSFERACRFHAAWTARRTALLDAYRQGGWRVVPIDATGSEGEVANIAMAATFPNV